MTKVVFLVIVVAALVGVATATYAAEGDSTRFSEGREQGSYVLIDGELSPFSSANHVEEGSDEAPAPGDDVPSSPLPPTTTQGDGAEGVACATDYQFTSPLSESGRVVLEFTVHRPERSGATGSGSDSDSGGGEPAGAGVLRARLTYHGTGWLGFGVSEDDKMPDSDVVIGMPGREEEEGDDGRRIGKYRIGNGYDISDIALRSGDRQTLTDASLEQSDGKTVLTFTKLLKEEGEIDINPDGRNTFLWAVGDSNAFGHHGDRGVSHLTLQTCVDGSEAGSIAPDDQAVLPDEQKWRAHGIMAFTAWGILTPIAIAASLHRHVVGAPDWFYIHALFNSLAMLLTVALFGLAVATYSKNGLLHFRGGQPSSRHQRMGLAMFVLVCLQVIGGFARPHLPYSGRGELSAVLPADADESGGASAEKEAEQDSAPKKPTRKSNVRLGWEVMHKLSGVALLACSMYQIDRGLQLYEAKGYDVFMRRMTYWAWMLSFLFVVFCLGLCSSRRG